MAGQEVPELGGVFGDLHEADVRLQRAEVLLGWSRLCPRHVAKTCNRWTLAISDLCPDPEVYLLGVTENSLLD